MEAFVLKTLKRIRKEAPRRLKDLRNVCDDLIEALSNNQKAGRDEREDSNADKYFDPLQAACESRNPKLMEISLDAIHFLIEHGYLKGNKRIVVAGSGPMEDSSEMKSTQRRTLMDLVIETVSKCSEEFDDNVQLQVIKALLTAVTSTHCEVHEASLLHAIRACFHIHLISKNQINKTTAKAALTQMLSVVFQRMELFDARAKAETEAALAAIQRSNKEASECDGAVIDDQSRHSSNSNVPCGNAMYADVYSSLGFKPFGVTPTPFGFDIVVNSGHVFPSILHKDAFLIFRALCKLSMKGLHEDSGAPSDPLALQNKILSLELILHILEHSGAAFRTGDKFIYAIRQYLCVSLLGNCTSHIAQVIGLALAIFVALLERFKTYLKGELEVFVSHIFLRILESENSTYDHKMRVMEVFQTISKDPAAQVELFINYDCDFEGIDLFRLLVDAFAKIAKNPGSSMLGRPGAVEFMSSSKKIAEEFSLRTMGLEGLVIVLRSLLRSSNLTLVESSFNSLQSSPAKGAHSGSQKTIGNGTPRTSGAKSISEHSTHGDNDGTNSEYGDDDNISVSNNGGLASSTSSSTTTTAATQSQLADEKDAGQTRMLSFDRKQKINEEIELGILKFNLSPKKGLTYLANLGHLEMNPKSVAKFMLHYQDRLDKTAIGDYLGREREYDDGFCIKVLHEYVDSLDFENMNFDEAIRFYLSGFRLPGEAQKIDRIMEKFAERYYLQNRHTFASADMAFILAFSTIMLQTNLHNPAIRDDKRMTKEQFIKQNKGISADGELPDQMLMDIYDRILAYPIALNQDEKLLKKLKKDEINNAFVVFPISVDKKKKDAFTNERREMLRLSEEMIKQKLRSKKVTAFVRAAQSDEAYVRPMFEVAWGPMISVFSQILEISEDPTHIELCLEGYQHAIRLAARLDVPTARDTFINSLAKFTTLDTVKEMHQKNIECIKRLIDAALLEGDYLNESWEQLLQCLSQLARMQLFAQKLHTDDMFFSEHANNNHDKGFKKGSLIGGMLNSSRSSGGSSSFSQQTSHGSIDQFTKLFTGMSRAETARLVEEANAEMINREIDPVLIDRIFMNSKNLNSESIHHFVSSLCAVSLQEISVTSTMTNLRGKEVSGDMTTPRIFSLQKLVEVADFNMHSRTRIGWTNIWSLLAQHFTVVGVQDNHALAMYAIDSLKQLSIKFLQKEELSNFNFQRLFLKPFETIMCKSKYIEIKDLILRCLDIMIRACASNIRSGWRSIFSVFEIAAGHDRVEIAALAFDITERLMSQQFNLLIFDFVELMNCLVAFVAGSHSKLSLAALVHLAKCADHLAMGTVAPALHAQHMSSDSLGISWEKSKPLVVQIGEDASVFRLWWPLLLGLSTRVSDSRLEVRSLALETLHKVLRSHGHLFSPQTWEVVFKGVIFPIIDSAKTDVTSQPQSMWPTHNPTASKDPTSWIGTTASTVLSLCVQLFHLFRDRIVITTLLPEIITLLEGCICQDIESLARMGMKALSDLVLGIAPEGVAFDSFSADLITARVSSCTLRNLCMDFGDAGSISLVHSTVSPVPQEIQKMLAYCPISNRRKYKDSTHPGEVGSNVSTTYGTGKVTQILSSQDHRHTDPLSSTYPLRSKVQLSWGAILYTTEKFNIRVRAEELSNPPPRLSKEQAWALLSVSSMTSMVVTLDCLRLLGDLCQLHYTSWGIPQLTQLLQTLEACYHHASCFNIDLPLRQALRQRGFMRFRDNSARLPHLLEQETTSISRLLTIALRLYREEGDGSISNVKAAFAEPWVTRMSTNVYKRYCALDRSSLSSSDWFTSEQLAAYGSPMTIVLKGVHLFSRTQYRRNIPWVSPMLSEVSLCNDREIRSLVKGIFDKHTNPILLLASKLLPVGVEENDDDDIVIPIS